MSNNNLYMNKWYIYIQFIYIYVTKSLIYSISGAAGENAFPQQLKVFISLCQS